MRYAQGDGRARGATLHQYVLKRGRACYDVRARMLSRSLCMAWCTDSLSLNTADPALFEFGNPRFVEVVQVPKLVLQAIGLGIG